MGLCARHVLPEHGCSLPELCAPPPRRVPYLPLGTGDSSTGMLGVVGPAVNLGGSIVPSIAVQPPSQAWLMGSVESYTQVGHCNNAHDRMASTKQRDTLSAGTAIAYI